MHVCYLSHILIHLTFIDDCLHEWIIHLNNISWFSLGLLKAIGKELFKLNIQCEVIDSVTHKSYTHITFQLSDILSEEAAYKLSLSRKGRRRSLQPDLYSAESLISASDMCTICPFHIIFDKDLTIKQCGANVQKMSADYSFVGENLGDIATITSPDVELCYEDIVNFPNAVYKLQLSTSKTDVKVRAKSAGAVSTVSENSTNARKISSITLQGNSHIHYI